MRRLQNPLIPRKAKSQPKVRRRSVGCDFQTLLLAAVAAAALQAAAGPPIRTEHFDADPAWEGFHNRVEPARIPTVRQDFGYDPTSRGAEDTGAVGGRVTRSSRPAYYADKLPVKTLDDKLSASGTFRLSASTGGSGVFFGWFSADQPGASGRPINSLGLDFDGEGGGARLAVRLINGLNKSCGTFVTPFVPGKFRPTPIRKDGTQYTWTLSYDPEANAGKGRFSFGIQSGSAHPEAFEGKIFSVDLPEGFKREGATFDRFGLMNLMKAGGSMVIHFSKLQHDGKTEDLSRDPGWIGSGNRATYEDRDQVGAHDFGFSPGTHFAGGRPGEAGGKFWRSGHYGYYADRVGPLSLTNKLEARGKVALMVGAPDSDMYIGWFNSADTEQSPAQTGSFLGVHIGGPTRIGHYFQPAYAFGKDMRASSASGPIFVREKTYDWSLAYDPDANNGGGAIAVTLGNQSVTLNLRKGPKVRRPEFDRFGMFTSTAGGQSLRVYLDDLQYTASGSQ